MVMKIKILVLMVVGLVAAGCGETGYHVKDASGGYSDFAISPDVFSVSFKGNSSTGRHTVEKYLMRRCCEVTLANGYKYYIVVSDKEDTRTGTIYSGNTTYNSSNYRKGNDDDYRHGFSHGYASTFGSAQDYEEPGLICTIKCFKERPDEDVDYIDAEFFMEKNYPEGGEG